MTTIAQIVADLPEFEPLHAFKTCPRCSEPHNRVDYLCEACRTKDTRNKRAAGMKGQRVLKRMRAARAAAKIVKPIDPWPNPTLMLRSLLSRVGLREAGPDMMREARIEGMEPVVPVDC